MTLLGWVPEENLAESGSNVKSAAESRTERENLKRALDARLYAGKKVRQLQPLSSFHDESHRGEWFDIQKQICKCAPAHNIAC